MPNVPDRPRDKCPDGATDQEHDTMLAMTGQCPWCGQEED